MHFAFYCQVSCLWIKSGTINVEGCGYPPQVLFILEYCAQIKKACLHQGIILHLLCVAEVSEFPLYYRITEIRVGSKGGIEIIGITTHATSYRDPGGNSYIGRDGALWDESFNISPGTGNIIDYKVSAEVVHIGQARN